MVIECRGNSRRLRARKVRSNSEMAGLRSVMGKRNGDSREMATIAEQLSEYTESFTYDAVPENVRRRARHLILDAAGIALAASTFDFAYRTVNSLASFGTGDSDVIGMPIGLPLRDAVF